MRSLIKKVFLTSSFVFLSAANLFSDLSVKDFKTDSNEEALFLRRIVEYWEEDKKEIVKNEIEGYLQKGEQKEFSDHLKALLGNIYFNEKKYKEAAGIYGRIENRDIREKILLNHVQALWEVKYFERLIKEALDFMHIIADSKQEDLDRFYFLIGDAYYQLTLIAPKEEDQISLAQKARPYFEKLSLKDVRLKPVLGHLLNILKEYPEAANLYLLAADKLPEQKEQLLFQAAVIQMNFDQEKAIETFSQVCHLNGEKASDAALNKMVLLVELNKYSDLLLAKEQLEQLVDKTQRDKLHFLFGKAYMVIKDYPKAGRELSMFLENRHAKIDSEEGKLALMMLFTAGEKEEEVSFLDLALSRLEEFFPKEENLPSAYFARAMLNKKKKNTEAARKDFQLIEQKYQDFAVKEDFLMEAGSFYYETEDFLQSRLLFKTFVDKYKDRPLMPLAWRYFINSSIKLIEQLPMEKAAAAKAVLVEDLSIFLAEKDLCNEDEKMHYGFVLAKTIYELEDYEEAFVHLSYLFEHYPKIKNKSAAQLLMGSLQQKQGNYIASLKNFEEALNLDKDSQLDRAAIHLNLFNMYLDLAKKADKYYSFAAEHLYQAQKAKNVQILRSNLLWLADYYYREIDGYMSADYRHSIKDGEVQELCFKANEILDRLIRENYQKQIISKEKKFLEGVLFKKAMLLGYAGNWEQKKNMLLEIAENYEKTPDFSWEKKAHTYFHLAQAVARQNPSLALQYLEKVITLNEKSQEALAAQLEKIRLTVAKIDKSARTLDNPTVCQALTVLNNLKAQKNVRTEPLHLEASLDYIDIATDAILEEQTKWAKKLELLEKMTEDFNSDIDIISKDYRHSLKLFPDKARLVQAYLTFADAEKALLQAKLGSLKKEALDKAEALYKNVLKNMALTAYLDKKIKTAMEEINDLRLHSVQSEAFKIKNSRMDNSANHKLNNHKLDNHKLDNHQPDSAEEKQLKAGE